MPSAALVFLIVVLLAALFYTKRQVRLEATAQLQADRKAEYTKKVASLAQRAGAGESEQQRGPGNIDPKAETIRLYKLHEIYYGGIPDTYDREGNRIQGVKPDATKSIAYLEEACSYGNPTLWLRLASIYQNGMYNLEPDLDQAELYYLTIMQRFPYPEIYNQANEQLEALRAERHAQSVYSWLNISYTKKPNEHHGLILKKFFQGPTATPRRNDGTQVLAGGDLFRAQHVAAEDAMPIFKADDKRNNDMHNTHNSQVVSTVALSLKRLQDDTPLQYSPAQSLAQVRNTIAARPRCDKRDDALKSLDAIERNIIPLTAVGMTESEALNVIWNRIHTESFEASRGDLIDILYDQLADMQAHGSPVCATGRLERIVDTLSTFDDNVAIKPTYVITEEMMNKANQLRSVVLDKYNDDQAHRKQLDMGLAPDQDKVDTEVRDTIRQMLHKDYVDSGILTEDKFDSELDKWINEI